MDNSEIRDPELAQLIKSSPPRLFRAIQAYRQGKRLEGAPGQRPTFILYPNLTATPIWASNLFDWSKQLEASWQEIRGECLALIQNENASSTQITASVLKGDWKTFPFLDEGNETKTNQTLCPVTTSLLSRVPLLRGSCLGYCYFSRIKPGTVIAPHGGVSNLKLRCHLPLVVPDLNQEKLGMRVGDQVVRWEVGKCLIFDDSFIHAVWHHGEEDSLNRIVLLFDFWHPELQPSEIQAITYCLAANPAQ